MSETKEDAAIRVRRTEQRKIAKEMLDRAEARLENLQAQRKTHALLVSVAEGLYQEVDKLNKKAPAEEITKLMCEELNTLIGDATKLMRSDPYVARVKPFVAAGEFPQNRDALLVLRTLLQGLKRCAPEISKAMVASKALRMESGTVFAAVDFWLESGEIPDASDLQSSIGYASEDWLDEDDEHEYLVFDFERLDSIDDLVVYFDQISGDTIADDDDEEGADDE